MSLHGGFGFARVKGSLFAAAGISAAKRGAERLPPKRLIWNGEDRRMALFAAREMATRDYQRREGATTVPFDRIEGGGHRVMTLT